MCARLTGGFMTEAELQKVRMMPTTIELSSAKSAAGFLRTALTAVLLAIAILATADENQQTVSDIEGLWKLVEWHDDGEILTPPQIGGRSLLSNGKVLFMAHRESPGESEYVNGYGEYTAVGNEYSYEYEKYTVVIVRGDDHQSSSAPVARSRYVARPNGTRLEILDPETRSRGLILEGDRMVWIFDSRPLRVYERVTD